jgi:protein farnesyltransferase subunit beta
MKQPDGSFRMHEGGEIDVRGSYCALSISELLCIDNLELKENAAEFILNCQTYEGGNYT